MQPAVSGNESDSELLGPRADSLMEAMRATGYSLADAIADLVDNSITAKARNVWIEFYWNGSESWASVLDDGRGMSDDALREAMRLSSRNPLEPRDPSDLGRFGLGLKTASLSQCRCFTVISAEAKNCESSRRWDLDHLAVTRDWTLLRNPTQLGLSLAGHLRDLDHGTMVLWEKLDRLVGDAAAADSTARSHFLLNVKAVEDHIRMTFHRLMTGPGRVAIWFNQNKVTPWDPFLVSEEATQALPAEALGSPGTPVVVEPYVLPHHSRLSEETRKAAAGPKGWNAHQGFYVYRNHRLLIAGDWLDLGFRQKEHYKLARILVDLPNSMDQDWSIDVRKSKARPPARLRADLLRIAKVTRERAVAVYRHRGKALTRTLPGQPMLVWNKRTRGQRVSYVINRDHPLTKAALKNDVGGALGAVLRLVEEYVPVQQIWVDQAEGDETVNQPFQSSSQDEVLNIIRLLYRALRLSGFKREEAIGRLRGIEGYGDRAELIETALVGEEE